MDGFQSIAATTTQLQTAKLAVGLVLSALEKHRKSAEIYEFT